MQLLNFGADAVVAADGMLACFSDLDAEVTDASHSEAMPGRQGLDSALPD